MEETTIRPGYTMPTETDGTPADYSAIEAAVNAHKPKCTARRSLLGHPAMRGGV